MDIFPVCTLIELTHHHVCQNSFNKTNPLIHGTHERANCKRPPCLCNTCSFCGLVAYIMRKLFFSQLCFWMPSSNVYRLILARTPFVCVGGFFQPIFSRPCLFLNFYDGCLIWRAGDIGKARDVYLSTLFIFLNLDPFSVCVIFFIFYMD